jgi:hypothetical protein
VLCGINGACPECEFLILTMPHGLQDLSGPTPIGLPHRSEIPCACNGGSTLCRSAL